MTDEADVVVIGSGSAALAAALRASVAGLSVIVLEKTEVFGGTSAMSGAGIWIPANHIARAQAIADSREDALEYIRAAMPPDWRASEDHRWRAFIEAAPDALAFLDEHTNIRFELTGEADTLRHLPGAKESGRMLSTLHMRRSLFRRRRYPIRSSTIPHLITYREQIDNDIYHHPVRFVLRHWLRLLLRLLTGSRAQGTALMAGLVDACLGNGCKFVTRARARQLAVGVDERVCGVLADVAGKVRMFTARHGVVIASGGFEWSDAMRAAHFPGAIDRIASPRANEGDGHVMAQEAGAWLDRMDQANIYPCLPVRYEGWPHGLPIPFQAEPHAIIVNGNGQRFVSETAYGLGEVLDERDPQNGLPRHMPSWLVADSRFYKGTFPFRWCAGNDPDWLVRAETLEDLAQKTGIPPASLRATVRQFNEMCARGVDDVFHRGRERRWGATKGSAKSPFGSIERPPFYAVSFNRSLLGTKGGPRTNERGQVLRRDGRVIPGLYAAGLSMANPIGTRAIAPGTTLGPNLAWGYICAGKIAEDAGR